MNKTKNILSAVMYACIIISVAISVLHENDTIIPGWLSGNPNSEFISVSVMEILTIVLIPLALKLFKFRIVADELSSRGATGLVKWGSIRMCMICVPMIFNTLLYYAFMKVAFGYMAIICLICLIFIYPSTKRCTSEISSEK